MAEDNNRLSIWEAILQWFSGDSKLAKLVVYVICSCLIIATLTFAVAIGQGREVSIYPPKIGKKPSTDIGEDIKAIKGMLADVLGYQILYGKLGWKEWGEHTLPISKQPKNKDKPHITRFFWDKSSKEGKLVIVCRIIDIGRNYDPNDGAYDISPKSKMHKLAPGYYKTDEIKVDRDVTFKLIDMEKNDWTVILPYEKIYPN
jgi:hypothetical protein